MNYGYFDDANREYVITDPRTPTKWVNYVGTLAFGGLVDHTGGSLICKGDPGLNRITKYIPQLPAGDFKGSTLYLRTHEGAGYQVLTPFFVPGLNALDRYECHVGMGYTRLITEVGGLRTEATFFVPPGESRLITDVRITNLRNEAVTLDAIPVVEYTHFDALKQYTNADWVPQTMQSWATQDGDLTILTQCAFMKRGMGENYFTANLPAASFETDRKHFLGANEYGTWANPLSLQADALGNHEALRGDNVGALLLPLGELAPGTSARFVTQLGQVPEVSAALPDIRRYFDPAAADAALEALNAYWQGYLGQFQVNTPDTSMNSMLNVFNPRQCHTTKNWSRYLSLYQLGLGARGLGFRDSSQDVMGVLSHMPDEGRELITKLLSVQRRDGAAMHQFYPLSMQANMGDAREETDRPQFYSDDHLWSVLAVCAYLKETANFAYLDYIVPFYEKDQAGYPQESASVLDHLRRAVAFTRRNVGQHGLPLAGFADWNDTVNLPTGAESLFTANLYGRALRELIALFEALEKPEDAEAMQTAYAEMEARVNKHAWDGDWYVRYFTPEGTPVGSHQNEKGQIFTNAQSWSVLSGFAPAERATQALNSVNTRLNTPKGIKLSTPGYDGFDPIYGGVSTFPPGAKENGGIFLHANPWVIIAETMQGNGDRAYQYYTQINPAARNDVIDEFECEPYVYPQNILGDEHPQFGLARNSWLSGTSSWMYQAATQYILGIQPTYAGLRIDPCIPAAWEGYTATRFFRGATYAIEVRNPEGVNRGVVSVEVDGATIEGNVVPVFPGGDHTVVVTLG